MEGTIIVNEERKNIDKFRNWYKEKIINTGKSQNFEKKIAMGTYIMKKKNDIGEKVIPFILTFIPEAKFLSPLVPILAKLGNKLSDLEQSAVIKTKRYIEAKFIGVDGTNKEVILPKINVEELSKDISTVITNISEINTENESVGKTL